MKPELSKAILAVKNKDYSTGSNLLKKILHEDPNNVLAWLWMSEVVNNNRDRRICLEQVLRINPENKVAKRGLELLDYQKQRSSPTNLPSSPPNADPTDRNAYNYPIEFKLREIADNISQNQMVSSIWSNLNRIYRSYIYPYRILLILGIGLLISIFLIVRIIQSQPWLTPSKLVISESNIEDLVELAIFNHPEGIPEIRWSHDSELLAVAEDKDVWIYTANELTKLPLLIDPLSNIEIYDVGFSNNNSLLIFVGMDHYGDSDDHIPTISVWDIDNRSEIARRWVRTPADGFTRTFDINTSDNVIAFNECYFASATSDGHCELGLWNFLSDEEISLIRHDTQYEVLFSPDGSLLATGSRNYQGDTRFWDVKSGLEISIMQSNVGAWGYLQFSPNGDRLAVINQGDYPSGIGAIKIWDVNTGELLFDFDPSRVIKALINPNWTLLALGDDDGNIQILDLKSGEDYAFLQGHDDHVRKLAFNSNGRILASADADTIRFWDVSTGDLLNVIRHESDLHNMEFNPEGTIFSYSAWGGSVHLWGLKRDNNE